MFTGIVAQTGQISQTEPGTGFQTLTIQSNLSSQLGIGDSIAVDGVCLTVVDTDLQSFQVNVVPETLSRSTLGSPHQHQQVNLELPTPVSGRFDGHIVQGHVDGIATVLAIGGDVKEPSPATHIVPETNTPPEEQTSTPEFSTGVTLTLSIPKELERYVVEKGTIILNGVALTVAAIDDKGAVQVALIPHTLAVTNLSEIKAGDILNLETDILAKYVEKLMARS